MPLKCLLRPSFVWVKKWSLLLIQNTFVLNFDAAGHINFKFTQADLGLTISTNPCTRQIRFIVSFLNFREFPWHRTDDHRVLFWEIIHPFLLAFGRFSKQLVSSQINRCCFFGNSNIFWNIIVPFNLFELLRSFKLSRRPLAERISSQIVMQLVRAYHTSLRGHTLDDLLRTNTVQHTVINIHVWLWLVQLE